MRVIKLLKSPMNALIVFTILIVFIACRYFFYGQVGDDSYIYFRYVDRAVAGQWWSWTDQLQAVEGYSSPLWYLILITFGKLGLSVIEVARMLGAVFFALTIMLTAYLSRVLGAPMRYALLASLLLVLNHGFNYWASAGLETSMYAALVVAVALALAREKYWVLPLAMIGLSRPEGMFLLVGILLGMAVYKRHLLNVKSLMCVLLPSVLWLLLRWKVYGQCLPNTFYAKATGELGEQLLLGFIYGLPVLMPLLVLWLCTIKNNVANQIVVMGLVAMLLGIVVLGGGDWMFHFRLLLPLYALILALAVAVWNAQSTWKKGLLAISFLPYLMMIVPPYYYPSMAMLERLPVSDYQEGELTPVSVELAKELVNAFPHAKTIAVNHAGVLPWAMPSKNFIDMAGLSDPHIAHVEGNLHHKYDADYVLAQKPELIILNSRVKPGVEGVWYHKGYWVGEDALVEHPDFNAYKPTSWVKEWRWRVPFPYSLIQNAERSWVLVYQRVGDELPSDSSVRHLTQ